MCMLNTVSVNVLYTLQIGTIIKFKAMCNDMPTCGDACFNGHMAFVLIHCEAICEVKELSSSERFMKGYYNCSLLGSF